MTAAEYMARALELAARGRYTTPPNPAVGAVLVKDGRIVGEGWHQCAGFAHAETNALQAAGARARGATLYVTLEPCSHTGRTPPCADALINAGILRCHVAMQDPNPRVAGNGLERMRCAGIEINCGLLEAAARALNPGFIRRMQVGRPEIWIKLAMSVDGRTAMASGESQWISSAASRQDVQRMRALSSVIITGSGTVIADDPRMTVRTGELGFAQADIGEPPRQPVRVVVDGQGRVPTDAQIFRENGAVIIALPKGHPQVAKHQRLAHSVLELAPVEGHLDVHQLLDQLTLRCEANLVMVEAGAGLAGAFLRARLLDRLYIYMAPKIMGAEARGLFQLPGLDTMKDSIQLQLDDIRRVGADIRLQYSLARDVAPV